MNSSSWSKCVASGRSGPKTITASQSRVCWRPSVRLSLHPKHQPSLYLHRRGRQSLLDRQLWILHRQILSGLRRYKLHTVGKWCSRPHCQRTGKRHIWSESRPLNIYTLVHPSAGSLFLSAFRHKRSVSEPPFVCCFNVFEFLLWPVDGSKYSVLCWGLVHPSLQVCAVTLLRNKVCKIIWIDGWFCFF